MNANPSTSSIPLLRWTLGVVVLLESIEFVLSASTAHFLATAGLPSWLPAVLGGAEIVAVILFLLPMTARVGSYLLLVVFAVATGVHVLHGHYNVGGLVVYATVVLVCMPRPDSRTAEIE